MSKSKASAAANPVLIDDDNLLRAWSRILLNILNGTGTEISPLILSATGFDEETPVVECSAVRQTLDQLLKSKGKHDVEAIAFAIFPQRFWQISDGNRAVLYELYRKAFPRLQAMNRAANGRGMYFERLTMYGSGPCDGNQLEWILSQYASRIRVRRSMLQAAVFDPKRDHVGNAQLGFPCLQQVSFEPTLNGLVVNAFYATQQIFFKAYGNYLGLARLGAFMAHEMGMRLARLNVMVGVAKLERINKSDPDLVPLVAAAKALVSRTDCPINAEPRDSQTKGQTQKHSTTPERRGSPELYRDHDAVAPPLDLFQSQHPKSGPPSASTNLTPVVLHHLSPARVSEVYDTYWRFAVERQNIFYRRLREESLPWTNDRVLAKNRFTNVYRASDRVSQYLIRHVIYRSDLPNSPDEIFFRILLFKLFNRIDTWKLLERSLGPIIFENYDFTRYDQVLTKEIQSGRSIYSAAYIMPPGSKAFGRTSKHQNHLILLERMMADSLPERLAHTRTMQDAFEKLRSYPTIGDFLAYQFVTDINYSEITDFSEMEFVVAGPGARDGLRKCFIHPGGLNEAELIRLVADLQESEFERLGLNFLPLWGRRLQLIDCQNLFCEVDKYARVAHPDVESSTGRKRIKQRFQPDFTPIELFFPPKWNLNATLRTGADPPQIPPVEG